VFVKFFTGFHSWNLMIRNNNNVHGDSFYLSPHYATINTTSTTPTTWSLTRHISSLLAIMHNLEILWRLEE
jgi:hypothetical protein